MTTPVNQPPTSRTLVRGAIIIDDEAPSFAGATVYVYLEDVSRADGGAQTVAHQVLTNISHQTGHRSQLAIDLAGAAPDERASYTVRVHVDVDGDGQISRGDYITMQSYPVLTFGYPNQVTVQVRAVP